MLPANAAPLSCDLEEIDPAEGRRLEDSFIEN
jgi:hypothetical protein